MKIYILINHIVNYFEFCWNLVFPLESVGTTFQVSIRFVGTNFRSNDYFSSSNNQAISENQRFKLLFMALLERWTVGTKNNTPGN